MSTLSTACLLGSPLLALCLLLGAQEPPPQEPPATGTERVRIDRKKLSKDLQGAWRLVEFRAPALYPQGRRDVGYCLIAGNCLSLELHIGWMSDAANVEARSFQSGTHTFELDDEGHLNTSSLIGAFVNRARDLEFEFPGVARKYRVALAADRLTLTRSDDHTLIFERMTDVKQGRDFFGRPQRERTKQDADKGSDMDGDVEK